MPWFKGGGKAITHKLLVLVYTENPRYRKKQLATGMTSFSYLTP